MCIWETLVCIKKDRDATWMGRVKPKWLWLQSGMYEQKERRDRQEKRRLHPLGAQSETLYQKTCSGTGARCPARYLRVGRVLRCAFEGQSWVFDGVDFRHREKRWVLLKRPRSDTYGVKWCESNFGAHAQRWFFCWWWWCLRIDEIFF